ncbi:S8 family serine peptidase [Paenibacillus sp. KS-LC4]|uniref:S8 family serine peptidase n=1 Tax=Paenibacillus sp. KS-LC4 TaxID=2979727 RepID=UPI0030D51926
MRLHIRFLCMILVALLLTSCITPISIMAQETSQNSELQEPPTRRIPPNSAVDQIVKQFNHSVDQQETNYKPDDELRVIIELKSDPVSEALQEQGKAFNTASENQVLEIQSEIQELQTSVVEKIDESGIDLKQRTHFTNVINGFSGTVQYKDISSIQSITEVKSVHIANRYERNRSTSVPSIGASALQVNDTLLKGENMIIAIIDDGIDYRFAEFEGDGTTKTVSSTDLTGIGGYTPKVIGGYNWADRNNDVIGTHVGHGTHVAGIAAGTGDRNQEQYGSGVAPRALLLAEKVFSNDPASNFALADDIIAGIDHAISHHADVINLSLGSPAEDVDENDPEQQAVQRAVNAGIVVTTSAGNFGGSMYPDKPDWKDYGIVGSPGVWPGAFTVAAATAAANQEQRVAAFSSRGPAPNLDFKPNITAPGSQIVSTAIYGGEQAYQALDGTSMAAPHVAGAAALVKQAMLEKGLADPSVSQIEAVLSNTAKILYTNGDIPFLPNAQGAGFIQVEKAVAAQAILTENTDKPSVALKQILDKEVSFTLKARNLTNQTITYAIGSNGLYTEDLNEAESIVSKVDQATISTNQPNDSLTLEPYGTASFQIQVQIPSELELGRYLGGWITLTGENLTSLSIPYFGYYGDWNSIPMFNEIARFDGTDNNLNKLSPTALYNYRNNVPLGYDYAYEKMDPQKVAFSPLATNREPLVMFNYQLLRFAKQQVFQIVNENNEVLFNYHFDKISKGFLLNGGWYWNKSLPLVWDGLYYNSQTGAKELVSEGRYKLRVRALSEFGDAASPDDWQTIELPVLIDLTQPVLEPKLSQKNESDIEVQINGSDQGGSGMWGYDVLLNDRVIDYKYLAPATETYTIHDVPTGQHKVTVQAWDYAGNFKEVSTIVNVGSSHLQIDDVEDDIFTANGKVQFHYSISDEVAAVRLMEEDAVLDEQLSSTLQLQAQLDTGHHELVIRAYDNDGVELAASKPIQVHVNAISQSMASHTGDINEGESIMIDYTIHSDAMQDVKRIEATLYGNYQLLSSAEQSLGSLHTPITVKHVAGYNEGVYYELDAYDEEDNKIGHDWNFINSLKPADMTVISTNGAQAQFESELFKVAPLTVNHPFIAEMSVTEQVYRIDVSSQSWGQDSSDWTVINSVYPSNNSVSVHINQLPPDDNHAYRLRFEAYQEDGSKLLTEKYIGLFQENRLGLNVAYEQSEWPVFKADQVNTIDWTVTPGYGNPDHYTYQIAWSDGISYINESTGILDGAASHLNIPAFSKNSGYKMALIAIQSFDANGEQTGHLFYPVRIDNTKPVIDLFSIPFSPNQVLSTNRLVFNQFKISDSESKVDTTLSINGVEVSGMSVSHSSSFYTGSSSVLNGTLPLTEGRQTISIEAIDEAGNIARLNRSLLVDTKAPSIQLEAASQVTTEESAFIVKGTAADDLSLQEIAVNGNLVYSDSQQSNYGKQAARSFSHTVHLQMGQNIITVDVLDKAGNAAVTTITVNRMDPTIKNGGAIGSTYTFDTNKPPAIKNGTLIFDNQLLLKNTITENGQNVSKLTITPDALNQSFKSLEEGHYSGNKVLKFVLDEIKGPIHMKLPLASLAEAKNSAEDIVLFIQLGDISYKLPLRVLDIQNLMRTLKASSNDINVHIRMGEVSNNTAVKLAEQIHEFDLQLLGGFIEFDITAEAGENIITLNDYDNIYVERIMTLPLPYQANEMTAVTINPDNGGISFVPATFHKASDNRMAVIMKRPGNSIYSVVKAKNHFTDITGHWAQGSINLMANKLIVRGISDTKFAPEKAVSRAEFASMLVRSLGLSTDQNADTVVFKDIASSDWFWSEVNTAVTAKLVNGYKDGSFRPNQPIKREEMAVMAANAIRFIENKKALPNSESKQAIKTYQDQDKISKWAQADINYLIQNHMMTGLSNDIFSPHSIANRAQATVLLKLLLQNNGFINDES